jgi:hypothetical protein
MVTNSVCGDDHVLGYYYFWMDVDQLKNGPQLLRNIKERLGSGKPMNGTALVLATESKPGEQHIAKCHVSTVKGMSGPPSDCTTVAIATESHTWVRTAYPSSGCLLAATYRLSGAIDIRFNVRTPHGAATFAKPILKTLETTFGLSAVTDASTAQSKGFDGLMIRSAAPIRDSRILSGGWREALDLDVEVIAEAEEIKVSATAHILVSRQAVGQLTDYSGLTDAQRSTYATVFDDALRSAIISACKSPQKLDSENIVCD